MQSKEIHGALGYVRPLDTGARAADMPRMRNLLFAIALLLVPAAGATAAEPFTGTESSVLAPYRFQPPPKAMTPLEQQKALSYRAQVQNQLRQFDLQPLLDRHRGMHGRLLLDSRRELNRMNNLLVP